MPAGRPPKPTATKRANGNPGKRRLPDEPTPPPPAGGVVLPPFWTVDAWPARGMASRMWARMAAILGPMGLLTEASADALALLCDAYAEYVTARGVVAEEGATYERTTDRGGVSWVTRAEVAQAADAWRRVNAMMGQFGLTPSALAKVGNASAEDDDPFAAFDGPAIADGKRAS